MRANEELEKLSREELIELIGIYAKNWLAHDGLWFQAVERGHGMDEAMRVDEEAWRAYTVIEARRIKEFLKLPERPGLEGLARALRLRFYGSINEQRMEFLNGKLVYRNVDCRVQAARAKKGLPFHPCKSVGLIEYAGFAKTIDGRISCRCLSCYPDATESPTGCAWEFTLNN